MNSRTVVRVIFLLLTVLISIYLGIKTKENVRLTAKFKHETLGAIRTDSLTAERKFDLLDNETTGFTGQILEDTSHVREGIYYLMGVIGLFIASELVFFSVKRKKGRTKHVTVKPNNSQHSL